MNIPGQKFTKLFTKILSISEHKDADVCVGFKITGKNASVCILLWKTEEIFYAYVTFINIKLKSQQIILLQFSKFSDANAYPMNELNNSKLVFGGLYIEDTRNCLLKKLKLDSNYLYKRQIRS